jgi:hypothetical protein
VIARPIEQTQGGHPDIDVSFGQSEPLGEFSVE